MARKNRSQLSLLGIVLILGGIIGVAIAWSASNAGFPLGGQYGSPIEVGVLGFIGIVAGGACLYLD